MCGDSNAPAAPSSGDLIAIIHPVIPAAAQATRSPRATRTPPCNLRLSNSNQVSTIAEFWCLSGSYPAEPMTCLEVRIQYAYLLGYIGQKDPINHSSRTNILVLQ